MALALPDGTPEKTQKAKLLNKLEDLQRDVTEELDCINYTHHIFDGGLLLHSILSITTTGATFGSIARNILSSACSTGVSEIYICFDQYRNLSIKQSKRKMRGCTDDRVFLMSSLHQSLKQTGLQLLRNENFKEELAKFLLKEWKKDYYAPFLKGKTLFATHAGTCYSYTSDFSCSSMMVQQLEIFQNAHEEANTLITFFVF